MSVIRRGVSVGVLVVQVIACGVAISTAQTREARVMILSSQDAHPYSRVMEGIEAYFRGIPEHVSIERHGLGGNPGEAVRVVEEIRETGFKGVVVTIGSLATETAARRIVDIPIVATLILRLEGIEHAGNVTAVLLEYPVETQFEWIRRVVPGCRTIGVIYNPEENRTVVERAGKAARDLGLRLEAEEIDSASGLPAALSRLANRIDVLWGLPDRLVLASEAARTLLLYCFRNRIPFIGASEAWVKAGALFSLEWDYADLGRQCAEMALKILGGARVETIPPSAPRKVLYCLNQKTAHYMRLAIPEEIARNTGCVF